MKPRTVLKIYHYAVPNFAQYAILYIGKKTSSKGLQADRSAREHMWSVQKINRTY